MGRQKMEEGLKLIIIIITGAATILIPTVWSLHIIKQSGEKSDARNSDE